MCGIAAHLSFQDAARSLDLRLIEHRGPDATGEWVSANRLCWLGSTRLAILDLSPTGAQPMTDPLTGNTIVSNGEIYNHWSLRAQLGNSVAWRGTSDTETLLHGYGRWGQALLPRLKGMFAFAIYDPRREELFIARDRFGIKPLYYTVDEAGLRLASEIRLLIGGGSKVTAEAISAYLQWGACPEEQLLFAEVRVLPPGHGMIVSRKGECHAWRYWPARKRFSSAPESAPQKVRALLEIAVNEHLLSDVPVASFLSGGIDSSIITALAAQRLKNKLQTFTVGFGQPDFDESAIAREVAERFGTDHRRLQLSEEEVLQSVTEAIARLDLPSVDAVNTYIVSRAVAGHGIKVALSGLGGDELFGGYPSFRDVPRLKWLTRLPRSLRDLFGNRLADLPNESRTAELGQWRRRFFTDAMLEEAGLPRQTITPDLPLELPDDFAVISWIELTGYMRHLLLRDADQMSMAVSLELRVPFLDHELVEYVLGLPAREKQRHRGAKGLLVEACRDLLPPAVYERPKRGFALPMQDWMKGPLASFVEDGVREVTTRNLLPEAFVADLLAAFRANRLHWTRLWSIAVLGHFVGRTPNQGREHENLALHTLA
jgi:asparagine synthase (glutamine-hydrolysing)